eukprot:275954-Pleurochrysis_carterae.AAC.2
MHVPVWILHLSTAADHFAVITVRALPNSHTRISLLGGAHQVAAFARQRCDKCAETTSRQYIVRASNGSGAVGVADA